MEPNHLHLLVNHAPIFGTFIGLVLLIIGFVAKNHVLEKTAFITFIISGFAGSVAYFSGGDAAGVVKHFEETSRPMIKEHAQLGKTAFYMMIALAIASTAVLVIMWRSPNVKSGIMKTAVIALAAITFGILGNVAYLGGKIRRPELRNEKEKNRMDQPMNDDVKSKKGENTESGNR